MHVGKHGIKDGVVLGRVCAFKGMDCLFIIGGRDLLKGGLHAPDLTGILGNGAVTGELARSGNVVDHLLGPFLGVLM